MSLGVRVARLDLVRLVEQAQRLDEFEEAIAAVARELPADAGAILNFFDVPTGDVFDVEPEQAAAYFKAKGLKPTFSYADMMDEAHDHAFTVAKMMDVDMLGQVRASLDSALANGQTFKEWTDSITPVLQSGGWWGRKEVLDPLTGQPIVAQLGSPWRLETIFRTNMQTAYAAGAWQEIEAQKDLAPFLMYDAIDDLRTRPLHASWDRKVFDVDHPWWSTHYPPNGYNCRCGVIQLSADELEALGITPSIDPPKDGSVEWTNPRTGETLLIPRGIDPGFTHNAGKSWQWASKQLLAEKVKTMPPDMRAAAKKAKQQAEKISADAVAAAKQAQAELASAAGKAALARAQAIAAEKSKQWAAQQQIDAIAKGKESAGVGAQYKIKALAELKKTAGWAEMRPADQLDKLLELSAVLKKKNEDGAKLSLYKKAVLDGKTPPPSAVKVFNALPEADKAAFLAKIDAEKAAADAKKAAEAAADAKKAAGAEPSPAAQAPEGQGPDPATMVVIGRKTKGGTSGALYQDTATGQKWLVKFNGSVDAVRNEVLAGRLYNLAGVEAPDLHAITIDGKPALASRIIDGITEVDAKTLAGTQSVLDGFAVDAWLANWDVAGLNFDNVVLVAGRAVRIDVGGALRYRAIGGLKGAAFGRAVGEIDSLRDGTNAQAQAVFGKITKDEIERGVEKVLAISDTDIRALVAKFGPLDDAERVTLADTLIARKRDLERRFPEAAARVKARQAGAQGQPEAPVARVTAAEQRFVEESRVNGYGFPTDSDQIEDNMVVVHTFKRADGGDATRGFFKLLPSASKELRDSIAKVAGEVPTVPLGETRQAILEAVKSINFRASKGDLLDTKVVARIKSAVLSIDSSVAQLRKAAATATNKADITAQIEFLQRWRTELEGVLPSAQGGSKAFAMPIFDTSKIPDALEIKVKAAAAAAADAIKWKKVNGTYQFETANFERSFAKLNGGSASVSGTSLRYEASLPDGTKIVYFPHDASVAWAMQGVVKIDAPGRGADVTTKVFDAMSSVGLKSTRASEIDRQHLYLNAFARIRLLRGPAAAFKSQFDAITERTAAGVAAKLELLKKATGVDVAESDGWRRVEGVRQAFGHGRAYQLRPDLTPDDLDKLNRTHVVFHNPQGLGTDAGSGVFDRLKMVIDGGGMFASLTDRVRRGVALSGSSVSSDLASGGGDYHFTRIRERGGQSGAGVYWKASVLRRMDAITYDSDQFGRTTAGHVEANRQGQTIEDFRVAARSSGNETIFKGGLSIFDDLDRIVLASEAEVKDAIAWMKSRGYSTWPDGRKLEEVITSKEKLRAKP